MGMRRRESSDSRSSALTDSARVGAEATAKVLTYAATLLVVGTCTTRWWLTLRLRGLSPLHPPDLQNNSRLLLERLDRVLAGIGLAAATLLVVSLLVRLWAHTYSAFGWSESLTSTRLLLMALQSRWGSGWSVQALVALAVTATFMTMVVRGRGGSSFGWASATLVAWTFSYALALVGHGAGTTGRVVLHGTHVVGAGVWVGSLAVLLFVSRELSEEDAHRVFGDFWMIATSGVALLLVGGVAIAVLYVQSWSNLWSTTYGRVLMLKLVLVGVIASCGAANWRRYRAGLRPNIRASGAMSDVASHRIAAAEVLVALAVVVVTSILTELEHP